MTAEDQDLLNQIAQLAGSINRHKRGASNVIPAARSRGSSYPYRGHSSFAARGRFAHRGHSYGRGSHGTYPYVSARSRGASYARAHRSETQLINQPCANYTRTGKCTQGLTCRYVHDPDRVALCLASFNGKCTNATCTLNHKAGECNAPMCDYFARGRCNRAACKYTHMVGVQPNAQVCNAFALGGWCDHGAKCSSRHAFECPDFAGTGKCPRPRCHLQHVISAPVNVPFVRKVEPEVKISVSALLDELQEESDAEAKQRTRASSSSEAQEMNSHEMTSGEEDGNSNSGEDVSDSDDSVISMDKFMSSGQKNLDASADYIEL